MSLLNEVSSTVASFEVSGTTGLIVGDTTVNELGITSFETQVSQAGVVSNVVSASQLLSSGDSVVNNLYVNGKIITPKVPLGPAEARRTASFDVRVTAAQNEYNILPQPHPSNGDETLYPTYIAQFSKGLQHDGLGNPVVASYDSLLTAVNSGLPPDYDAIQLGGAAGKLVSPQAALCYTLQGTDSAVFATPVPAAFASDVRAAQSVETYWMALTRDVKFSDYGTDPTIAAACADLSAQPGYTGPKVGGLVTPDTVYRVEYPGTLVGPYISQMLYIPFYMGAVYVDQKIRVPTENVNFSKTLGITLGLQSGGPVTEVETFQPVPRLIITGRDLAEWVHNDLAIQTGCHALQVLRDIGCPLNVGNPYKNNATQDGFATFGGPHIQCLLGQVAIQALRATWFQKWSVNRTLRPEEYGLRVHQTKTGAQVYPVSADILNSQALVQTFAAQGTYLLSQAFPEGCPHHPSYPSGHATFAGATITVLKAWFDGSFVIPAPLVPSADGSTSVPYVGPPLTVEGELNKLATNVAQGRVIAGVHYRSDSFGGIELGEQVAIAVLRDQKLMFNEPFAGFTFTKFDGTVITV